MFKIIKPRVNTNGSIEKETVGKLNNSLVPRQVIGSQINVVEERKLNSLGQAQEFFSAAARRLLAVNE